MNDVRAKKYLGQHFLTDSNIARKIAGTLSETAEQVVEIGPGTGMLTRFLLERSFKRLVPVEIDAESVVFLKKNYPQLNNDLIEGDFLKLNLSDIFQGEFAITGNFPYNISSQILFKALDYYPKVTEITGMFQKEVAERIVSGHGNKTYGILSVLLQVYYEPCYLFTVHEQVFNPPPKVKSAVIKLVRRPEPPSGLDKQLLFTVVKAAFNQRRKTLRNALAAVCDMQVPLLSEWSMKRAEQLSPEDFIKLTKNIQQLKNQDLKPRL